jgi:blocked early in transport 1
MYQRKKSNNNSAADHKNDHNNNNHSMYSRTGTNDIEGGRMRASAGSRNNGGGHNKSSINDTNANILEQQNNERMNELANHVALLKGLTIEIGNEVREQNSLLDNMNDGFTNTRDMLQNSLRRIGSMLEQGGTKHMCYMVLFCVGVMMLLWWLMSSSK